VSEFLFSKVTGSPILSDFLLPEEIELFDEDEEWYEAASSICLQ